MWLPPGRPKMKKILTSNFSVNCLSILCPRGFAPRQTRFGVCAGGSAEQRQPPQHTLQSGFGRGATGMGHKIVTKSRGGVKSRPFLPVYRLGLLELFPHWAKSSPFPIGTYIIYPLAGTLQCSASTSGSYVPSVRFHVIIVASDSRPGGAYIIGRY
jgi:hypothetical protein